MPERPPLRERKQQRVRETIVEAAFALFAERGFADVTVADIAERAEVGRTTFFRYFGDKQEVVFADEQRLMDELRARYVPPREATEPDLPEALEWLRGAMSVLVAEVTRDGQRYALHERLVTENPELWDRSIRKLQRFTAAAGDILRAQGASELTASLAPQLAFACYQAGRRLAGPDPEALAAAVDAAFEELRGLVG
ncbi:helix-turn-helix domain-containing protein [Streptomyces sp. B1866]|uniref:TetR/AcrR family transcriptional regulator n=1 Tax=Streptomyces sp. B1866 TaxID=3075431 RepID=UPI00288EB12D|nr:helix-turn-helix domain-containing protein [Streptomyces sp. B1866]MDT3396587.1 helix-turn-helix domain-containing protein [Streptomyces sp. B1866]